MAKQYKLVNHEGITIKEVDWYGNTAYITDVSKDSVFLQLCDGEEIEAFLDELKEQDSDVYKIKRKWFISVSDCRVSYLIKEWLWV